MFLMKMLFWGSLSFQNLLSPTYSFLESLHDIVMVWLTVILALVLFVSYMILMSGSLGHLSGDSSTLEKSWTLIPILILVSIALPSIRLLCLQDTMCLVPSKTVKVVSNQWNWQSETTELVDHLLDSEKLDELASFEAPLILPMTSTVRILVTSTDVLHSLGLPNLGVKLDSAPGRLNATTLETSGPSLTVGSCYELCGSGHSAMPIFGLIF